MQSLPIEQFDSFLPGVFMRHRMLVSGNGHIEHISASCYDLWELTATDIENEPDLLWGMVDGRDLPAFVGAVANSGRNLTDWFFQWRISTPSGRRKWLHGVGRPSRMSGGGLLGSPRFQCNK